MLLRFIAFIALFYLVYYFLRTIFVKPFKQGYAQGDPRARKKQRTQYSQREKEGDISISYDPRKHQRSNEGVGEYVDYEEVKE